MRTRIVLASATTLLVLAICASCGGGGGGRSGEGGVAPDVQTPAVVALTWTGGDDVTGYVVHWGTSSRAYSTEVDVRDPVADAHGTVTVALALGAEAQGVTRYFFAITSYDAAGISSEYSNELSIDVTTIE